MTTYSWKITTKKKIDIESNANVIVQAYWTKTGHRDGKSANFDGCCSFTLTEGADFVPFEDVTDSMVIEWVENSVDQDMVNQKIEQKLDADGSLPPWQV